MRIARDAAAVGGVAEDRYPLNPKPVSVALPVAVCRTDRPALPTDFRSRQEVTDVPENLDRPDPLAVIESGLRSGERSVRRIRLAVLLGVSERTIDSWHRKGLPVIKAGGGVWIGWKDIHRFFTSPRLGDVGKRRKVSTKAAEKALERHNMRIER